MGEFRRVGPEVCFGESLVELADVQPIHDLVATDLMLAARAPRIEFTDSYDRVQYAIYFAGSDIHEADFQDRFVAVNLSHQAAPDNWRMIVSTHTYTGADRHSNKRVCYRFESVNSELMQAKKEVFFVFGSPQISFDEQGEPVEIVNTERKMYEKPMQLDDCGTVLEMLQRTIRRLAVY